jgi:hypothetical protein
MGNTHTNTFQHGLKKKNGPCLQGPLDLPIPVREVSLKQTAYNPHGKDFLNLLPPELTIEILEFLNIEDLDTCALVCKKWRDVIMNWDSVWKRRCQLQWNHVTTFGSCGSWQQAYKVLRNGTIIANKRGIPESVNYLEPFGLVKSDAQGMADFLQGAALLSPNQIGSYVLYSAEHNRSVLSKVIHSQDYRKKFLPDALRIMFSKIAVYGKTTSSQAIVPVLREFVQRYMYCNPEHSDRRDSLHLLCYSVILLSIDRFNPHVKVKMTKQQFIRNNLENVEGYDAAYLADLFDNVCLWGHIAQPRKQRKAREALDMLT